MSVDDDPPRLGELRGADPGEPFLHDVLAAARAARPREDQLGRVATQLSAALGVEIAAPAPPPLGPPPSLGPPPPAPPPPPPMASVSAWWTAPGIKIGAVLLVASGAGVTSQIAFDDAEPAAMTSTTSTTMAAPSHKAAMSTASTDASRAPEQTAPSPLPGASPAPPPAALAPPGARAVTGPRAPSSSGPTSSPSPSLPPAESETALLRRAQAMLGSDPATALQVTEDHRRSHRSGALTEEREVIAVAALTKLGRKVEAETRAAGFRARFPGSAYLRRLDVVLGKAREDQKSEPPAPIQH